MDNEHIQYFNPYAKIRRTQNRLQHWQQEGASYFVTFRLGDSLPAAVLSNWKAARRAWLNLHPEPWDTATESAYNRLFAAAIDKHLDAGHGSCLLADPACSAILHDALLHFNGFRYEMFAFVIMPNHVHLLFQQNPAWSLESLLHSWRSYSSNQINKVAGRSGPLWQKDYFDRLIRDEAHFDNCVGYIRANPLKARLRPDAYRYYECPFL